MADHSQTDPAGPPQPAQQQGGVNIDATGPVNTGGDISGRDKIVAGGKVIQAAAGAIVIDGVNVTPELLDVLRNRLSPNALEPQQLDRALTQFHHYHEQLHEWKELHHLLSEILSGLDVFKSHVQPLTPNASLDAARQLWQSVSVRVDDLLDWARTIEHIGMPYRELPVGNGPEGEDWSVNLHNLQNNIGEMLRYENSPGGSSALGLAHSIFGRGDGQTGRLKDLALSFHSATTVYLKRADNNLRDTATRLYDLSKAIFGGGKT